MNGPQGVAMTRAEEIVGSDSRITLDHLRAFVGIAELRRLKLVGELLHRSESAVAKRIKELEDLLGCPLLLRAKGKFVGLTPAGRRFLQASWDVLQRFGQACHTVQHPQLCGQVRLGVPDDFMWAAMPGYVEQLRGELPGLRLSVLSLSSTSVLRTFRERNLDVAVVRMLDSVGDTVFAPVQETWGVEPLCWVANAALDFTAAAELPLVLHPEGGVYRLAALSCLAQHAKPFFVSYSSSSNDNMRRAIDSGLGVAVLPRSRVEPQHVVQTSAQGFPALPQVHVMVGLREESAPYRRVADSLRRLWEADTDMGSQSIAA